MFRRKSIIFVYFIRYQKFWRWGSGNDADGTIKPHKSWIWIPYLSKTCLIVSVEFSTSGSLQMKICKSRYWKHARQEMIEIKSSTIPASNWNVDNEWNIVIVLYVSTRGLSVLLFSSHDIFHAHGVNELQSQFQSSPTTSNLIFIYVNKDCQPNAKVTPPTRLCCWATAAKYELIRIHCF